MSTTKTKQKQKRKDRTLHKPFLSRKQFTLAQTNGKLYFRSVLHPWLILLVQYLSDNSKPYKSRAFFVEQALAYTFPNETAMLKELWHSRVEAWEGEKEQAFLELQKHIHDLALKKQAQLKNDMADLEHSLSDQDKK